MKSVKTFPSKMNDAVLLVSAYEDGEISGWLIHSRLDSPLKVQNMTQLLIKLDEIQMMDFNPIRSNVYETVRYEELMHFAEIRIRILFKEHYTWQGYVLWENEQMEAAFRSALELVMILDEILGE